MQSIERELELARNNLLDLTMRNRLLNFRPAKTRTLQVIDEIPREIYEILVLSERKMEFKPSKADSGNARDLEKETDNTENDTNNGCGEGGNHAAIWKLPDEVDTVDDKHVDRFLQTDLTPEELQKRLFYISQQSQSVLEEQGYTVLYLAIGFLEWKEVPGSADSRRAPIVLVPVTLERTKVGTSFRLAWTGEDIFTNISLQSKLAEQGVLLPEFEMPVEKSELDDYFSSVLESISKKPDWQILSDIHLGFFSFTKFVMYKDLDPESWPEGKTPASNLLIRNIFDPQPEEATFDFSEEDVDTRLNAKDLYHVMDADPSQIAVIEDVKSGCNLVVEGPPGTGKSQTITNIIAELLASGKTVLFVSEKMAALEVVKNRLDLVGLGDVCLELHSRKTNKKEFLKELERTINRDAPRSIDLNDSFQRLDQVKTELNTYVRLIGEPYGNLQISPFELYNIKEDAYRYFKNSNIEMPVVRFPDSAICTPDDWKAAIIALENLAEILPIVTPVSEHPWRGCQPITILPSDELEIGDIITSASDSLNELEQSLQKLCSLCSIRSPLSMRGVEMAIDAAEVVAVSKPVNMEVLLSDGWDEKNEKALSIIIKLEEFRAQTEELSQKFEIAAFRQNIDALLFEYRKLSSKFFLLKLFDNRYGELNQEITSLYRMGMPGKSDRVISDLSELSSYLGLKKEIEDLNDTGKEFFGSHWKGLESDPMTLVSFSKWITPFRQQMAKNVFMKNIFDTIGSGVSEEEIRRSIEEVKRTSADHSKVQDELFSRIFLNTKNVFESDIKHIKFEDMSSRLELWKDNISRLQKWAQFNARLQQCQESVASPMIDLILNDQLSTSDIIPCFKANFAEDILHQVFTDHPPIANFVGELHEKKIANFVELDKKLITMNRQRLAHLLYQRQPTISGGVSPNSEAGILIGEFTRKRKHMPIRKLMSNSGNLIQKIKPCFMMSPLSIAQFLDPLNVYFDVVVFDEASQVKPEDALGALLRAKQSVVIGDTRQLPPTAFFDKMVDSADELETDVSSSVSDMESILHLCKRSFFTKTLRWHYRSKHDSLIAVSNQEFYDNRLVFYPSPVTDPEKLGLKFVHLPDTVYDRGKTSTNRMEAQAVARAALEHYRNYPDKTLGIGTFNIRQQQAILEEIELLTLQNPEMASFFESSKYEHFFVKNLETIQGDERDVIFISVGFGFDQNGALSLNFGPLNQEGGERRLNVLITRAREKCVVFANFKANDLQTDTSTSFGLKSLKVFLDFAEKRNLMSCMTTDENVGSAFEESVYDFLTNCGYEVHKQVGCAVYKVDLAVVDPESPENYLLGIEFDGAKYHSSPVARDRDRLRQQVLESLGWKIFRIWSTDWYRNRSDCQNRLMGEIEEVISEESAAISRPEDDDHQSQEDDFELETRTNENNHSENNFLLPDSENSIRECIICPDTGLDKSIPIEETPAVELEKAIIRIVNVEGPVHIREVTRRIRVKHSLKRTTSKMKEAIMQAITLAGEEDHVVRKGDFLFAKDAPVELRKRGASIPAKIELICNEEIELGIRYVLEKQFATREDELIVQTSKLFGFGSTSEFIRNKIKMIVNGMLADEKIKLLPNGMLDVN